MAQCAQTKITLRNNMLRVFAMLLFSLLWAGAAHADIEPVDIPEVDIDIQDRAIETDRYAAVQSGYRFIAPHGPSATASPYERLKSGVTGGLSGGTLGSDLKLTIDSYFLHVDDYHAELFLDYSGLVRFHAESGTFWHNLLPEQVNPGTLNLRPLEQDVTYGIRTSINQADTRIKLGNNPFHLNLGYWELKREGNEQLRFSDHYFGTGTGSVITSTNHIERYSREGNIGLDAHLRLFDLSYGFRIRDFSNEEPAPKDSFTNDAAGALTPGVHAHNIIPDSRVTAHTFKFFTNLSGGLVGAASYNLTQRENSGGHGEAIVSERPSDILHSVAGDLTYTPSKRHSFALKYRHQEIDRSTPASLFYPYSQIPTSGTLPGVYTSTPGMLLVRPSSNRTSDTIVFSGTYRTSTTSNLRLEYRGELESRNNVPDPFNSGSPSALHSDNRQTHTGKASFHWRPYNGLRLNASYSYTACDNPAYTASFSDRHTGQLFVTYASSGRWGATASYLGRRESGENSADTTTVPNTTVRLPRKSGNDSANASLWLSPLRGLTVTGSYSYLRNDIDQAVLFASSSTGSLAATNYRSTAHVIGVDAAYALSELLDVSLAFQQIRSFSRFNVQDFAFTDPANGTLYTSDGIRELTSLDTTETGVSARADWRITPQLGCSLDYTYKMYNSGNSLYDGSVHATMVTLKARW